MKTLYLKFGTFFILIILGVYLRVYFGQQIRHPGGGQDSYQINIANNLYGEKGLIEENIYILNPELSNSITHPSNSFWMPLTSIIIYIFYLILGKTLFVAILSSIISGVLISIFTYLFMKELTENRFLLSSAFLLSFYLPTLFLESLIPSVKIYYSLFVLWSMYWLTIGMKRNHLYIILSSIPASLAFLIKIDAILLIPVVFMAGILYTKKTIWKSIVIFMILFVVFQIPWFIRNYLTFETVFPPGLGSLFFLQEYNDLFSVGKEISFMSYFSWGFSNILLSKLKAFSSFFGLIINDSMIVFALLNFIGLSIMLKTRTIRREIAGYLFFFLMLAFLFCFMFSAHSIGGAAKNSIISILPFFIIVGILTVEKIFSNSKDSKFLQNTVLITILIISIYSSVAVTKAAIVERNNTFEKYSKLIDYFKDKPKEEPIIMTEIPIELNYITGYKAIMIPNNPDSTIFSMSKQYKANYLLGPTKKISPSTLGDIEKFELKYDDPLTDLKLYKISIK